MIIVWLAIVLSSTVAQPGQLTLEYASLVSIESHTSVKKYGNTVIFIVLLGRSLSIQRL